jgi:hypothetical protein
MGAPRQYDRCKCGARKKRESDNCRACYADLRLRATRTTPDTLSYWPRDGRYGLLAVSGYAHENGGRYATTFSVLDSHDCFREVKRKVASGRRIPKARADLVEWIKARNHVEKVVAS